MENKGMKEEISKNKMKLKGSNNCVDMDLTKREREIQQKLRKIQREEAENGVRMKVGHKKLIRGNEVWRYDEESVYMGEKMFRREVRRDERQEQSDMEE